MRPNVATVRPLDSGEAAGVQVNAVGTNSMDFPGFIAATGADDPLLPAVAAPFVLFGLFAYEDAYVRAGQSVPLS